MATIDNLLMNKDALQTAIQNYTTRQQSVENCLLKMTNEIFTLDGTWNGEASEKFKESYTAIRNNLQSTVTALGTITSDLSTALTTYEEFEAQVTAAFNALEEGMAYPGL